MRPERVTYLLKQAVLACFALSVLALPARAEPDLADATLRDKLRAFDQSLTELPTGFVTARQMIAEAGLAELTGMAANAAPPPPVGAALATLAEEPDVLVTKAMDLRLALALVSQIYGERNNQTVINVQRREDLNALVIESGSVTLDDIFQQLEVHGFQSASDRVLRAPVILWGDARLTLGPGDVLEMSRTDGAFVMNFGRLVIDGATVRAVGDESPASQQYRPFLTNGGGASVLVRNAIFEDLGFGTEIKFSGFAIARNPLLVRKDEVIVENSTFLNIASLSVSMADNAVIRNNRLHDSRDASIMVTHSLDARITGNLITGDAPTNAIRLLQGSSRGLIAGNVILGGDRTGIVVRNDSQRAVVRNNVVWKRSGGGITISQSTCGVIHDNVVIDNRQKGIEVRSAQSIVVRNNTIIGNKSAGVWVSAQDAGEATLIENNTLLGNGSGLASATGERLVIAGNDFTRQFPRFVDGDLARQTRVIADDLTGEVPIILTAGGRVDGPLPTVECSD